MMPLLNGQTVAAVVEIAIVLDLRLYVHVHAHGHTHGISLVGYFIAKKFTYLLLMSQNID